MKNSVLLPLLLSIGLSLGINNLSYADTPSTSTPTTPSISNQPSVPTNLDQNTADVNSPLINSTPSKADVKDVNTYLTPGILDKFVPTTVFLSPLVPSQDMERRFLEVIQDIKYIHFNKINFLNNSSAQNKFIEIYLNNLDPTKSYFTKSQVLKFYSDYAAKIPTNLSLAFKIYSIYVADVSRFNYKAASILLSMDKEPNLDTNIKVLKPKYFEYGTNSEFDQQVYNRVLSMIIATKLDKPTFSWDQIRIRIIKGLLFKQNLINNYDPKDVFKTINASLALATDSHSDYYSPSDVNLFKEQIQSSFVGIGVGISQDSTGVIKFTRILKNGPSFKNGEVKKDDELLEVSQDGFKWVSVSDMQLTKVIKLLKGTRGTPVWVKLLSKAGVEKTIKIIRGDVSREDIKAELTTYTDDGKTYGVLHFGSFYSGLTNDIAALLDKNRNLSGLIIDLRNNGGGLVSEVLGISNIFIGHNIPIFQTTPTNDDLYGDPQYSRIPSGYDNVNSNYRFTKPIIVMVNSLSASASEIFSAAIQDYRRGIIVGNETFGKGTVQSPNYINGINEKDGLIKLTIQKFFRVNGQSTQFKGVAANVVLPPIYYRPLMSELGTPNPLPYTQIQPNYDYRTYQDYYVTKGIVNELQAYVNNYYTVNPDYKAYVMINDQLIAQQASKYNDLNYTKLLNLRNEADNYTVAAYNKYAKLNNKPTVKDIDQFDNMDIDKTLDPYLDLTKHLLVMYQDDLTKMHH